MAMPVEVRASGITWTPRGTFATRVGKPLSPPKTTRMPPQRPPRQIARRTITTLSNDPESVTMLEGLMEHWLNEAKRLELSVVDQTLTEKMARLMFEVDVPTKMKEQEQEWDPTGNGTITVGEFRQHVRGVGIEATSEELDALFVEWDTVGIYGAPPFVQTSLPCYIAMPCARQPPCVASSVSPIPAAMLC